MKKNGRIFLEKMWPVRVRLGIKMAKEKFVSKGIFGIHHVIAITSDPQRNIDFYANRR